VGILEQQELDPFEDPSDASTTRLFLLGPSGTGKTTLLRELCRRALMNPNALIDTALEIDPMRGTKSCQELKKERDQFHTETAHLDEILNTRQSAQTPENESSSRTALAITTVFPFLPTTGHPSW